MRFALVVIGSRGDVQPFLALGAGLVSRGHEARLVAPAAFEELAKEAGLEFRTIPGDPEEFFRTPEVIEALRKSPSMVRVGRAMPKASPDEIAQTIGEVWAASGEVDLIVNSLLTRGVTVARPERPWCSTSWWPATPTRYFPAMGAPELPLGGAYNRFTHWMSGQVEWRLSRPFINGYRQSAGLPPLGGTSPLRELGHKIPMVYPYSPSVLPKPPDWPADCHVTGYWFWSRAWQPPAELVAFLDRKPAPLALTFGSTWAVHRPDETIACALAAARSVGRRLVMIDGPADGLPDDVLRVHDVDYGWLFPRMAAVIHHGGFGTTAEVTRAGVPHVFVPTYADHPFWAARMAGHGTAPKAIPFAKLNSKRLAAAVATAVGDPGLGERAAALGVKVRAERGVDVACDLLERWAAGH